VPRCHGGVNSLLRRMMTSRLGSATLPFHASFLALCLQARWTATSCPPARFGGRVHAAEKPRCGGSGRTYGVISAPSLHRALKRSLFSCRRPGSEGWARAAMSAAAGLGGAAAAPEAQEPEDSAEVRDANRNNHLVPLLSPLRLRAMAGARLVALRVWGSPAHKAFRPLSPGLVTHSRLPRAVGTLCAPFHCVGCCGRAAGASASGGASRLGGTHDR
jgi:hypothetical protein